MRSFSRRQMLGGSLATGALLAATPAWARGQDVRHGSVKRGFDAVEGPRIDLTVGRGMFATGGRSGHAVSVNGSVPGPLLRLKQGSDVSLNVHNRLDEDTSVHWHGLLVPFQLDGVPGVSFPGIAPGASFAAEFPVRQAGTYWWHSHSGLQEQAGHYGPIIVEPEGDDPVAYDRDYVVLLSEFTPLHPHTIFEKLKKGEGYFNRQQRSFTDDYPLSRADRLMWAKMRMMPTDILDVTSETYTYLLNGHGPMDGLEYAFRPGERVRLRFINGSAMTFFNIRIPGLAMTVVQADGQDVKPVEVDEFQIGVAETYDVIVQPTGAAHTLVAESMDRSGMGLATLASRPGARAPIPPLRKAPLLTMKDMGMGGMDHGAGDMNGMDHGSMDHAMRDTSLLPEHVEHGPGVEMVSAMPVDRMGDPGIGLDDMDHRVLRYTDLRALQADHSVPDPTRAMEIHLTGNMERYMWSFDGKKFAAVSDVPIRFAYGERVRVKLVNDTMMAHPIHLHGHFFELVNGAGHGEQPRKHTVTVQPGGSAVFDLTADEPGDWAFHCHLLYHMHAGMFQIVSVAFPDGESA
ncbi:copper resistance system multicopper oxidase [Sphingomicrobium sp. XHP0235]|uniref:copper resistance system multicopper oxidase n=1 Tax=Sphingomicrobium aquimarinum TaxID=3133971 RepID=UPI0031FF1C23